MKIYSENIYLISWCQFFNRCIIQCTLKIISEYIILFLSTPVNIQSKRRVQLLQSTWGPECYMTYFSVSVSTENKEWKFLGNLIVQHRTIWHTIFRWGHRTSKDSILLAYPYVPLYALILRNCHEYLFIHLTFNYIFFHPLDLVGDQPQRGTGLEWLSNCNTKCTIVAVTQGISQIYPEGGPIKHLHGHYISFSFFLLLLF